MAKVVIESSKLTKFYGKIRGVENLNLTVVAGEIFGFLGPNGAGKTTTIRTILNLIKPSSGTVKVLGMDVATKYPLIQASVGYQASDASLYEKMTGHQLLTFASRLYQFAPQSDHVREVVEALDCQLQKPFRALSSGNKKKIEILLALAHQPRLLVLDEPTSGLDPLTQQRLYAVLRQARERGTTIFFSSHNLPEVEKLCDRVGIIKNGHLVAVQTVNELKRRRKKIVELTFTGRADPKPFTDLTGVTVTATADHQLTLEVSAKGMSNIIPILAKHKVTDLTSRYPDLEEVFMSYYE